MRIIGNGFLAQHLAAAIGDRHRGATVLAAGVSGTGVTAAADFDREADLLYRELTDCQGRGGLLVLLSTASFAMYGSPALPATEDAAVRPPSVYGRHKLALESVVRGSGVAHLVLRLSHVVGPGQRPHQLLPTLVRQIGEGSVTVLTGAHRDLLDVRDLVVAVDGLLTAGVVDQVVNVASGMPQPIEAVVTGIERRLGIQAHRSSRPSGATLTKVDTGRLRSVVPQFTVGTSPGAVAQAAYLDRVLDHYLAPWVRSSTGRL